MQRRQLRDCLAVRLGSRHCRPRCVDAVHALDAVLREWSYETRSADTGAYNCRQITGGSGYSLHAYGIALDINWQSNTTATLVRIYRAA